MFKDLLFLAEKLGYKLSGVSWEDSGNVYAGVAILKHPEKFDFHYNKYSKSDGILLGYSFAGDLSEYADDTSVDEAYEISASEAKSIWGADLEKLAPRLKEFLDNPDLDPTDKAIQCD